ncbi:MAG: hypothetical protein WCG05_02990 [Alphaproteobacteria bacterium]
MKIKFLALTLLLSLQSMAATYDPEFRELPTDRVLSLNEQEKIFLKAYEEVDTTAVHPIKTIIPGLAPMIRMHYSHVRNLVQDSPEHVSLLTEFWQKASKVVEKNQLTIGRMRSITTQLAALLVDWKKENLKYTPSHNWKDLDTYNDMNMFNAFYVEMVNPFRCEAILCPKKGGGGFSYERFARNYLDHSFPLNLAALCVQEEHAHGGLVAQSYDFLNHDLGHNGMFAAHMLSGQDALERSDDPKLKSLSYWDTLRSMLRTVKASNSQSHLTYPAIFRMLHEDHPSLETLKHVPALKLAPEDTELPLSARQLFLRAVSSAAHYSEGGINFFTNALDCLNGTVTAGYTSYIKSSIYSSGDILKALIAIDDGKMGFFKVDCKILSTEDPDEETIKVIKTSNLVWKSEDMEKKKCALEGMSKLVSEKLENSDPLASRMFQYRQNYKDLKSMLRQIYGDTLGLPVSDPTPGEFYRLKKAIDAGMKKFWRDFYLENKDLFSTDPL